MAPRRPSNHRRSRRSSKRASEGRSRGNPKGQKSFHSHRRNDHKVRKRSAHKDRGGVRLPVDVANAVVAEAQTSSSTLTSTHLSVANLRAEFLTELKKQFPRMPEDDQNV
jgi:hypothetical protein